MTACTRPIRATPLVDATSPIALAVITWNMNAGAGDLPRLVADLAGGRLTPSPPRDYVLLLQEAVAGAASDPADVAKSRQLAMVFEPVHVTTARRTGNAVVSTQPLTGSRIVALPRARQPRIAIVTTVAVAGVELFFANAHFENRVSLWRGLLFSDGPRGRQAAALLAQLPDGPGVAGGDLNTWLGPTEPAWRALQQRFSDTPVEPSPPTFRNRLVLDHLFFDLPDGWRVERHVVTDGYGSDHRPVIGVIRAP